MGLFSFLKKKKDDTGSVTPASGQPSNPVSADVNGPTPPTQTSPPATTPPPTPPVPPAQ